MIKVFGVTFVEQVYWVFLFGLLEEFTFYVVVIISVDVVLYVARKCLAVHEVLGGGMTMMLHVYGWLTQFNSLPLVTKMGVDDPGNHKFWTVTKVNWSRFELQSICFSAYHLRALPQIKIRFVYSFPTNPIFHFSDPTPPPLFFWWSIFFL